MAFSFSEILYSFLFFVNAIAILSEERFLSRSKYKPVGIENCDGFKVGWGGQQSASMANAGSEWGGGNTVSNDSIKLKLVTFIHAVRTLLRSMLPMHIGCIHRIPHSSTHRHQFFDHRL